MYCKACRIGLHQVSDHNHFVVPAPLVAAKALAYYFLFVDQILVYMLFPALVGSSVVASAPASELCYWALRFQNKELMLCMALWSYQILSFLGLAW